ncbi:universal stress protein [Cognatishimia sp. WU-CL00825]|uniref:universal stress protein n=1 Tax=Cognatishimia sp. WU-CL00825 TaxID=3127658 RepID=UPI0031066FA5
MYKNILIPISFDEDSTEGVLRAAAALADHDAKVTLLHVMGAIPKYASSYFPKGYRDEAQTTIEASLRDMAKDLPNTSGVVAEGQPGRTILEWARDHAVDCILLSAHREGSPEFLLGSTAAQVVRHATCGVHIAR